MKKSKAQTPLSKAKKLLENTTNLAKILDKIPDQSAIKQYKQSVQKEIILQIIDGKNPYEISKNMHKLGFPKITYQQVARVRKRILPVLMRDNLPESFFRKQDVEEQLKNIEFLISEQYARVCDKINSEDELKGTLRLNKKITFVEKKAYQDFVDALAKYYEGTLPPIEEKILLSYMEPRGYDPALTKDLMELMRAHKEYLALRVFLGDKDVKLNKDEEEIDDKVVSRLSPEAARKVAENMRKKALGVTSMVKDEADGVYKPEDDTDERGVKSDGKGAKKT